VENSIATTRTWPHERRFPSCPMCGRGSAACPPIAITEGDGGPRNMRKTKGDVEETLEVDRAEEAESNPRLQRVSLVR
jgi:hypothetical protein